MKVLKILLVAMALICLYQWYDLNESIKRDNTEILVDDAERGRVVDPNRNTLIVGWKDLGDKKANRNQLLTYLRNTYPNPDHMFAISAKVEDDNLWLFCPYIYKMSAYASVITEEMMAVIIDCEFDHVYCMPFDVNGQKYTTTYYRDQDEANRALEESGWELRKQIEQEMKSKH